MALRRVRRGGGGGDGLEMGWESAVTQQQQINKCLRGNFKEEVGGEEEVTLL